MTPIDFVLFDGDSNPNQAVIEITEALQEPLIIRDSKGTFSILSYYWTNDGMTIDIERNES